MDAKDVVGEAGVAGLVEAPEVTGEPDLVAAVVAVAGLDRDVVDVAVAELRYIVGEEDAIARRGQVWERALDGIKVEDLVAASAVVPRGILLPHGPASDVAASMAMTVCGIFGMKAATRQASPPKIRSLPLDLTRFLAVVA